MSDLLEIWIQLKKKKTLVIVTEQMYCHILDLINAVPESIDDNFALLHVEGEQLVLGVLLVAPGHKERIHMDTCKCLLLYYYKKNVGLKAPSFVSR